MKLKSKSRYSKAHGLAKAAWLPYSTATPLLPTGEHGRLQYFSNMLLRCPPNKSQAKIITQIEKEQSLVNANKELITLFEQKIKDKIASVWGE